MQRRVLATLMVIAVLLSAAGAMAAPAAAPDGCRGQGYWKRWIPHEESFSAAGAAYSRAELLGFLNARGGGAPATILAPHYAAAFLNAWNGCPVPASVHAALTEARAYLADPAGSAASRRAVLAWKDTFEAWNENRLADTDYVVDAPTAPPDVSLLSAVYSGTGCAFGSHLWDILTLTFSDDIVLDEVEQELAIHLETGTSITAAGTEWEVAGPVLTITVLAPFADPLPMDEQSVTAVAGIGAALDRPVTVPAAGVPVEGADCTMATLLSVELLGVGDKFGMDGADTLVLTFSRDIVLAGGERLYIADADSLGNVVPSWSASGNTLTITANQTFSPPRPSVGAYVTGLDGVISTCGCPVCVPPEGVAVTLPSGD